MSYRNDILNSLRSLSAEGALGKYLTGEQVTVLADFICKLPDPYAWRDITEHLPRPDQSIEMTGPSGYIEPNQSYVISGYYDSGRPMMPWRTFQGEPITDYAPELTHWRYMTSRPYPPKLKPPEIVVGELVEIKATGARLFVKSIEKWPSYRPNFCLSLFKDGEVTLTVFRGDLEKVTRTDGQS